MGDFLLSCFLSLSSPPVFEFTATARMAMGSGFLVLSPNIIKASLLGHCPLPLFGSGPAVGKKLKKNHFFTSLFLNKCISKT